MRYSVEKGKGLRPPFSGKGRRRLTPCLPHEKPCRAWEKKKPGRGVQEKASACALPFLKKSVPKKQKKGCTGTKGGELTPLPFFRKVRAGGKGFRLDLVRVSIFWASPSEKVRHTWPVLYARYARSVRVSLLREMKHRARTGGLRRFGCFGVFLRLPNEEKKSAACAATDRGGKEGYLQKLVNTVIGEGSNLVW